MLDPKVIVTPGLELGVILCVVIVAHIFQSSVKMDGVLFIQIVGGEVTASSKPPSLLPFRLLDLEVPVVAFFLNIYFSQKNIFLNQNFANILCPKLCKYIFWVKFCKYFFGKVF